MRQDSMLQHLHPFETLMFQNSIKICFNDVNGLITYDDELVGSRASDVENKRVTDRKAGNEGPMTDCVADSLTHVMFHSRLRVAGVTEAENMKCILDQLPLKQRESHSNINNTYLILDRGYGKMKLATDAILSRSHRPPI